MAEIIDSNVSNKLSFFIGKFFLKDNNVIDVVLNRFLENDNSGAINIVSEKKSVNVYFFPKTFSEEFVDGNVGILKEDIFIKNLRGKIINLIQAGSTFVNTEKPDEGFVFKEGCKYTQYGNYLVLSSDLK